MMGEFEEALDRSVRSNKDFAKGYNYRKEQERRQIIDIDANAYAEIEAEQDGKSVPRPIVGETIIVGANMKLKVKAVVLNCGVYHTFGDYGLDDEAI